MRRLSTLVLLCGLRALAQDQIQNIVATSAASFKPGLPARGSIGTIFCTGLSANGVITAGALPLPTNLGGITVSVGGFGAPLFAVADLHGYQQINFQVPQNAVFSDDGTAQISVSQNGNQGSASALYDPTAPGEFFTLNGTQFGIFQHAADYSLVTQDNPASPGETLIAYATGLPEAEPAIPDGQPAPIAPLSTVRQQLGCSGNRPDWPSSEQHDIFVRFRGWLWL